MVVITEEFSYQRSTLQCLFRIILGSFFIIEIEFIYSVLLVSDVQQNDSVLYIYKYKTMF